MLKYAKLLVLAFAFLVWVRPASASTVTGMIIGRTGELLHISLPEPVKEGSILQVKPLQSEPSTAEVRVVSCTHEFPYVAMAKVVRSDGDSSVATGVRAFADAGSEEENLPRSRSSAADPARFSIQAGTFQPSTTALSKMVGDNWQAYRLNYSLLKIGKLDTQLSAEYDKGTGSFLSGDTTIHRTMEIMPVTVFGRIRPVRMGGMHFFLGAGAGYYTIRTTDNTGPSSTTDTLRKFGTEYSAGFEHKRGWILELRYQDVPETDIRGYSLALGGRF